MLLKEIQNIFHKELDAIFGKEEVDNFFFMLTEDYLGMPRFILALQPGIALTKEEEQPVFEALAKLKHEEPIQYILGKSQFFGLTFKVNSHTLIPRPETEELVAWIVDGHAKSNAKLNILDIGTGSGCIAISLAKSIAQAQVLAMDISNEAIDVAKTNAIANQVEVQFMEADILRDMINPKITETEWDIIVSNPPYVRNVEKAQMKNNVLNYEPHQALFVDDDNPLLFYEAIVSFAIKNLSKDGSLYFEINQNLGSDMVKLLKIHGFKNIELKKDLFGNERMVKASGRFL